MSAVYDVEWGLINEKKNFTLLQSFSEIIEFTFCMLNLYFVKLNISKEKINLKRQLILRNARDRKSTFNRYPKSLFI